MSKACPSCAGVNPDDSMFCQYCGAALAASPPAAPSPPPPPPPAAGPPPPPPAAPYAPPPAGSYAPPVAAGSYAPPPAGSYAPPPAGSYAPLPAGREGGHQRPGFKTIGIAVGAALVVAVVVGLVVPNLGSHHKTPTATVIGTSKKVKTPPSSAPTTIPAGSTPTTIPAPSPTTNPSPTTDPAPVPTTAPSGAGGGGAGGGGGSGSGQTVHNSQVEVTLPSGWSVNSQSSSTTLVLNGPGSVGAGLSSQQVASSTTLSSAVQSLESSLQQNATDAKVCSQPQQTTIPGGIAGAVFGECLTTTAQGSQATPIEVIDFVGLKAGSSSSSLYLIQLVFPQSTSSATFKTDYSALLDSVQWATTSS